MSQNRRVSFYQLEALWEIVNANRALATGNNKSCQDREYSKRMWRNAADALNSHSDGAEKDWKGWCKYWNYYKCRLKSKVANARASIHGGGPIYQRRLTKLELKFLQILGIDFGSGLPEAGMGTSFIDLAEDQTETESTLLISAHSEKLENILDEQLNMESIDVLETLEPTQSTAESVPAQTSRPPPALALTPHSSSTLSPRRRPQQRQRRVVPMSEDTARHLYNPKNSELQNENVQPFTDSKDPSCLAADYGAVQIMQMVFSIKEPVRSPPLETLQSILTPVSVNAEELLTVKENAIEIPNSKSSKSRKRHLNEDSLQADNTNEIKVFCPKCNAEISHSAEGIQADQTKIVIAKVYHYFEQEYEELKKSFDGLELTPLSKFRQRTALATGVSETTVVEVLQEEARRNAEREEQTRNESLARKRPRQTDSSSEEDSESGEDGDDDQSSTAHETLVVKEEPAEESLEDYNEEPEIYVQLPEVKDEPGVSRGKDSVADPISIDFKTEQRNVETTSSNDAPVVQRATKRHKGMKTKRKTEAPPAASASPTPSAPPASSAPPIPNAPPTTPRRHLLLLDDGKVKVEQTELEEGFS